MTKKSTKGRAPARRRMAPKRAYTPTDGITQYVSAYFEVNAVQPNDATALGGRVGYSIKLDALDAAVYGAITPSVGGTLTPSLEDGNNGIILDGAAIPFTRLTQLAAMYRQYRINSVNVKVTTDRVCGLDNPLLMLTDKGDSAPVGNVGAVMKQAHKTKVLTEADRTMSYGWKPSTAQDREFHMVSDKIPALQAHFIKVLQEVESHPGVKFKHRIELGMSVTLKDSKN